MKYKHDFTSVVLDKFLLIHQIGLENTKKYYSYPKIITFFVWPDIQQSLQKNYICILTLFLYEPTYFYYIDSL